MYTLISAVWTFPNPKFPQSVQQMPGLAFTEGLLGVCTIPAQYNPLAIF
jgi:hypothetical protein